LQQPLINPFGPRNSLSRFDKILYAIFMKHFSILFTLVLILGSWTAQGEEIEDQYLKVMRLSDQAETLKTSGRADAALAKYKEAQRALLTFQKNYPRWNMNVVSFRLNELTKNINALSGDAPPATSGTSSDSQVKLLEPGAEPRKVLRLKPNQGDQQTLIMTIKTIMNMQLGDIPEQKMKLPGMEMTLTTTVKEVSKEGDITYEVQFTDSSIIEDVEVMPQISEGMKTVLANMKGMSGTASMSSRGISKKLDLKAPEGADPQTKQTVDQMKQSLSSLSAPLPSEAVGIGAKWEAKMPFQSQGMKINQTVVYELTSLEQDRLSAKSTITQSAANQKIQNPTMPGLKLDLTKMEGNGTGEMTMELSKIVATDSLADIHAELNMSMDTGGQKQAMTMKMDSNVSVKAK
jgi:hypothetical protein